MRLEEFTESAKTAIGRKGSGIGRKYRCTSGSRKGRMVANPTTCNAPKNVKKSVQFKATKARLGGRMKTSRKRTMSTSGRSQAIQRLNKGGPKGR